jgi:hypothetical protein
MGRPTIATAAQVTSSDYVLSLVRQALDEFDDRPLEASGSRAVRIASLIGDSKWAWGCHPSQRRMSRSVILTVRRLTIPSRH